MIGLGPYGKGGYQQCRFCMRTFHFFESMTMLCHARWDDQYERKDTMARLLSTLKYARYAMGSLTAVLFQACVGGS